MLAPGDPTWLEVAIPLRVVASELALVGARDSGVEPPPGPGPSCVFDEPGLLVMVPGSMVGESVLSMPALLVLILLVLMGTVRHGAKNPHSHRTSIDLGACSPRGVSGIEGALGESEISARAMQKEEVEVSASFIEFVALLSSSLPSVSTDGQMNPWASTPGAKRRRDRHSGLGMNRIKTCVKMGIGKIRKAVYGATVEGKEEYISLRHGEELEVPIVQDRKDDPNASGDHPGEHGNNNLATRMSGLFRLVSYHHGRADNLCSIDALKRLNGKARGIACIDPTLSRTRSSTSPHACEGPYVGAPSLHSRHRAERSDNSAALQTQVFIFTGVQRASSRVTGSEVFIDTDAVGVHALASPVTGTQEFSSEGPVTRHLNSWTSRRAHSTHRAEQSDSVAENLEYTAVWNSAALQTQVGVSSMSPSEYQLCWGVARDSDLLVALVQNAFVFLVAFAVFMGRVTCSDASRLFMSHAWTATTRLVLPPRRHPATSRPNAPRQRLCCNPPSPFRRSNLSQKPASPRTRYRTHQPSTRICLDRRPRTLECSGLLHLSCGFFKVIKPSHADYPLIDATGIARVLKLKARRIPSAPALTAAEVWGARVLLYPTVENAATCYLMMRPRSRTWRARWRHDGAELTTMDAALWAASLIGEALVSARSRTPVLVMQHEQLMLAGPEPPPLEAMFAVLEMHALTPLAIMYHVTALARQLAETVAGNFACGAPLSEAAVRGGALVSGATALVMALYREHRERERRRIGRGQRERTDGAGFGVWRGDGKDSMRTWSWRQVRGIDGLVILQYVIN
ncbi:hypothetical protein GGX14DRAFT_666854 [Mycena pura]|uniref:Uncharacterized protein n=1 Tax=Mycena pura TaxID=153505 RepID=A0AAD6Y7L6_9AGAR|nr:hypothetical protein GGX14DRAFT_666854 [Mycena pura]